MSLKPSIAKPNPQLTTQHQVPHVPRARGAGLSPISNANDHSDSVNTPSSSPTPEDSKKHSSSLITVLIAVGANLLIAIAKTVGAFMTGSASMIAEAAHSWADAGNGTLLIVAEKK